MPASVDARCRYPVLVDPQGQGRRWLMNREEANQLVVTQLNDKTFRNALEECLTFGKPLLIENIEVGGHSGTDKLTASMPF